MGMRASYQIIKDGNRLGDTYFIDKAYNEFAAGLDALGLKGWFIVWGTNLDEPSDDADFDDYDATYAGGLCPAEVVRNWQKLRDVTFEQFLVGLRKSDLGDLYDEAADRSYLEGHFATLKEVYRTAAAERAGIETPDDSR